MIFPEFSLANLSSLGYTEDEARFLYVVATHSGYFSMRQFLQFTGTKSGDKSMTFSQKLLGKGHATARSFLRNGLVYHLFARIVYRAISRENLRNRRAHSLEHIRTRLVALDFVLAHLQYEYLETEDDKLNYFCQQLDIPKELLPRKRYSGPVHNTTTERYFVDKFPMFLCSGSFSSPCGYLHLRRSRTWHSGQFQDPSAGLWKSVRSASRGTARLYFASSNAVRDGSENLSGHRRPLSEERPGRRNPPLFPAPEAVGRAEIREAHNRRQGVPPSLGQALRPSSVPETLSKLARRHRIGRLRPLGDSRSGTTTQSDLRKRAGGRTDWLISSDSKAETNA